MRYTMFRAVIAAISAVFFVRAVYAVDVGDFEVGGRASGDYEAQWSDGNDFHDHDLFSTFYLTADQKDEGPLSAAALFDLNWDLDGHESSRSPFSDMWDTYSNDLQARLYLLYVDVDNVFMDRSKLRIGRQTIYGADVIRFDGLKYDTRFRNLEVYAFGGQRYSFYSNQHEDAYTAGSGAKYYPAKWTRLGIDYARSKDNEGLGTDSVMLSASQRFCKEFQTSGRVRFLDDETRDVRLRARLDIPQIELSAIGTYFRQINTLRQFANEYSSFYQVESDYHPFEQYGLTVYKPFGDHYTVSVGTEQRKVIHHADLGSFNREFKRYHAGIDCSQFLDTPLHGSLAVERWETDVRDRVNTLGAEMGIMLCKDKLDVDLGTSYAGYKYDLYRQDERSAVRTYYAQAKYDVNDKSKVSMKLEKETDELAGDPFYTLKLGWMISF